MVDERPPLVLRQPERAVDGLRLLIDLLHPRKVEVRTAANRDGRPPVPGPNRGGRIGGPVLGRADLERAVVREESGPETVDDHRLGRVVNLDDIRPPLGLRRHDGDTRRFQASPPHQRDLAQRKMTIRNQLVWVGIWLGAIAAAAILTFGAHEVVSWVVGT